jgi:acyl-CoA reductase-like NAD-dependent aldehyde dehydrogenase
MTLLRKITPATGLFRGSFIHPLTSQLTPFGGVIFQRKQPGAAGQFIGEVVTGGSRHGDKGYFVQPTIFKNCGPQSTLYREEIFGPVASFFCASDAAQAIKIANDSSFGLGASAWTNDAAEGQLFASELEAGMVFINRMVASDPRLPFGGAKRSGFGRELGEEGIREFVNIKTVSVG